ncbi:MAG: Hsp20/alpha crystallin family protein [Chitinophagaceae bacterium]
MEVAANQLAGIITALPPKANNSNTTVPTAVITDNEQEFVLVLPVSGVQREQINVCIKDSVLYISIRKNKKHVHCGNNLCEHDCMLWRRAFALPGNADTLMTTANYNLGELVIRIPKDQSPQQDDITIYVY